MMTVGKATLLHFSIDSFSGDLNVLCSATKAPSYAHTFIDTGNYGLFAQWHFLYWFNGKNDYVMLE